jgi:hypothetical protein
MQLSLVAYYGHKPGPLRQLIEKLYTCLADQLGGAFQPYHLHQVHATLIGIELFRKDGAFYSHWYRENIGIGEPIDLSGLLNYLRRELPDFRIKIGGYEAQLDHGFLSRDDHPYDRSFSFQGSTAVVVGWPAVRGTKGWLYDEAVFQLRRSFEQFYLCHKWHKDGYRDNDCYLVLGSVDRALVSEAALQRVGEEVRNTLTVNGFIIPFTYESLAIVAYDDPKLPLGSTRVFPLDELGDDISVLLE